VILKICGMSNAEHLLSGANRDSHCLTVAANPVPPEVSKAEPQLTSLAGRGSRLFGFRLERDPRRMMIRICTVGTLHNSDSDSRILTLCVRRVTTSPLILPSGSAAR
jgi:hypothetical protein